tara:strand:+ start:43 stop:1920 length:1878 start_codon:yes stop_codon:yes gene_type:complete
VKKRQKGGVLKMQTGGLPDFKIDDPYLPSNEGGTTIGNVVPEPTTTMDVEDYMGQSVTNPTMPAQSQFVPQTQAIQPGEEVSPEAYALQGQPDIPISQATTTQAQGPAVSPAAQVSPALIGTTTPTATAQQGTGLTQQAVAQQGVVSPQALAQAQQGVSQGLVQQADVTQRQVTAPEQVTGAVADTSFLAGTTPAQTDFVSQVEGATMAVTPEMTVQGQLARISQQFTDGQVPSWAAGVVRNATAVMAQRGLAASSMAGAAITQAILEASVPIATADAQTYYNTAVKIMDNQQQANLTNTQNNLNVSLANMSNRQQTALAKMQVQAALAGQTLSNQQQANILNAEKFAEAANLNFTQEQQRVFSNSKMVETLNLQNLNNAQTVALSNAANFAKMDTANLNNRQQAMVLNAQGFLQMDMSNLSNAQQIETINQQARLQTLLSDQAAQNAAQNFNATSQNQVNQFFETLASDIRKLNATQANSHEQFNAGQANALSQFRATMQNTREQFNTKNALEIAQSNATWRRNVNTANTASVNAANQINAANYLGISNQALANIWQQYRDEADYVYNSSENAQDRAFNYAMAVLDAKVSADQYDKYLDEQSSSAIGGFIAELGIAAINRGIFG